MDFVTSLGFETLFTPKNGSYFASPPPLAESGGAEFGVLDAASTGLKIFAVGNGIFGVYQILRSVYDWLRGRAEKTSAVSNQTVVNVYCVQKTDPLVQAIAGEVLRLIESRKQEPPPQKPPSGTG
jgi:hypothetical protein